MHWTEEQTARAMALQAEKLTVSEIADRMGLTKGQVSGRLHRKANPPTARKRPPVDISWWPKAAALYPEKSPKELAAMFNHHVSTIYGMLHKLRPELFDTGNYYAQQRLKEIAKTQELEARRKDEVRLPNWLPEKFVRTYIDIAQRQGEDAARQVFKTYNPEERT